MVGAETDTIAPVAESVYRSGRAKNQDNIAKDYDTPSAREAGHAQHHLQINGGKFLCAGRDVNHHTHFHEAPKLDQPTRSLMSELESVDNFRQIQQDILSKATPKTGEWIFEHETFPIWRDPKGIAKTMWGSGIPGAGKTVLTSIVVHGILKWAREQVSPICVCYIYIRYSDNAGLTVRHCLEVLVKQTIEKHPSCLEVAEEVYAEHLRLRTRPTEDELLDLLRTFTTVVAATFYFLDALDEAPIHIRFDLLDRLSSLNVKLFVTSRPLKALEECFPQACHFAITARESDLDLHIGNTLDGCQQLGKILEQGGAALRGDIAASVKRNCGGMFLHAMLQLAALQHCASVYDVRKTLANFPPKIEDVYRDTWIRIVDQGSQGVLAQRFMIWVLNAPRSMTVAELQHVAAISLKTHKFDPNKIVHKDTLVALCHGLLIVDEETALVRLIHYTAKETLKRLILETSPRLHPLMASLCIGRLIEHGYQCWKDDGSGSLESVIQADPLLLYAYHAWSPHAQHSLDDPSTAIQVKEFVRGCRSFPVGRGWYKPDLLGPLHVAAFFDLPISLGGSDVMNAINPNPRTRCKETPLHMACRNASHFSAEQLLSLRLIDVNATNMWKQTPLICACRAGDAGAVKLLLAHPKISLDPADHEGLTAFAWAAAKNDEALVRVILVHSPAEIHSTDGNGRTALCWACRNGNFGMAKFLLAHSQSEVHLRDKAGRTPLSWASSSNCIETFNLILSHAYDDVHLADKEGRTPLSWASSDGSQEAVDILLSCHGTDVNQLDNAGWTPLSWASVECRAAINLLLATPGIDVNLADRRGWTPLIRVLWQSCANSAGAERIMKTMQALLAHPQINVNLPDNDGLTPLMWALQAPKTSALSLLLAHPMIDVNLPDNEGKTPLHRLVSSMGRDDKIELLLTRSDIDVNAQDYEGRTPLSWASECNEEAAKLLIAHPYIKVNLPDIDGQSPLTWALRPFGNFTLALLLTHPTIDVNLPDNEGQTPLHKIVSSGCSDHIIPLLLSHPDIDVNVQDDKGRTPLSWVANGNEETAKLLLAHPHVEVNLPDRQGRTPLIWVAMQKRVSAAGDGYLRLEAIAQALLTHPQIDINQTDDKGRTALSWASKQGQEKILQLLLEHPQIQVGRDRSRVRFLDTTVRGGLWSG